VRAAQDLTCTLRNPDSAEPSLTSGCHVPPDPVQIGPRPFRTEVLI